MKKIVLSVLILTMLSLTATGCTKEKKKVESEASKVGSGANSTVSKIESDVESKTSEIGSDAESIVEENDGGLVGDDADANDIDNDTLPEVSSNTQ